MPFTYELLHLTLTHVRESKSPSGLQGPPVPCGRPPGWTSSHCAGVLPGHSEPSPTQPAAEVGRRAPCQGRGWIMHTDAGQIPDWIPGT